MAELLTLDNFFTLCMLILLQAVLGFDNLLYISLESQRVEESRQRFVRQVGIGVAVILRLVLLFVLLSALQFFQDNLFSLSLTGLIEGQFNLHAIIVLFGGAFILYTALKEISHMLVIDDFTEGANANSNSVFMAITLIVSMNLVFSFDSILSAIALTDVFLIMAIAIVSSGVLMIWLADYVSEFLTRNRMYEVLGLFILFIVGILLISEGGHLAHLKLFGYPIEPMAKSTFYFVIAVLVVVDLVQSRYQKKLQTIRENRVSKTSDQQ